MAPFVGRQPELAVLQARLSEALAGRPQTVQIQGPAGIGKTALLEHFLNDPGSSRRRSCCRPAARKPSSCWPTGSRSTGALRRHPVTGADRGPVRRPVAGAAGPVRWPVHGRGRPGRRPGDGRRQVPGFPGPAGWSRGGPCRGRRALGRPTLAAGADLRAAAAGRRPGAGDHRGSRRPGPRPAGQSRPADPKADRYRAAAAGIGRRRPARARRRDGHRRCQRGCGPSPAVRHAGKPVARQGIARGIPAVGVGLERGVVALAAVVPQAGAGPLPILRRADPQVDRRGRRARVALPAAGGRRAGDR